MNRKNIGLSIIWIIFLIGAISVVTVFSEEYLLGILIMIIGAISLVLFIFESKDIIIDKIVLISLLSALASAGRVIFSGIPSVQPSSFIIIMSGIGFGKEIGMMVGIITAFSSNIVLGQGPWTPWQIFLWGLMGFMSGMLLDCLKKNKAFRMFFGFIWGFLFGWIMNIWFIVGYSSNINIQVFLASCVSSFYFDLAHSISNVILLAIGYLEIMKIFERISKKYNVKKF